MANVLVVDGDVLVLNIVADVLESADHTVWKAGSESEGLQLLRGHDHFDLLIAEVAVDDAAGVTLIQQARSEKPRLPILAISGFAGSESIPLRQSLRRLHVSQVLRKPFQTQILELAVSAALGEKR